MPDSFVADSATDSFVPDSDSFEPDSERPTLADIGRSIYNWHIGPVGFGKAEETRNRVHSAIAPTVENLPWWSGLLLPPWLQTFTPEQRKMSAQMLSGLAAAPQDPATYLSAGAGVIPRTGARVALSAGIGALPSVLRGDATDAAVQGGIGALFGISGPHVGNVPEVPTPIRGGVAPESWLIPAERPSVAEAAQAAQEGFSAMTRPVLPPRALSDPELAARYGLEYAPPRATPLPEPDYSQVIPKGKVSKAEAARAAREGYSSMPAQTKLTPPLRTAAQIAMEKPVGPGEFTPDVGAGHYGIPPEAKPKIQYPEGRTPRTRTAEGGFVALPEDDSGNTARMATAKIVANAVSKPEFRSWFGESKVADDTGNPIVVYHGTKRPDRVGGIFKKSRATSGPMAYFTDDPQIASGYATGKQDTSLALEDTPFESWFKYKPQGSRTSVDIDKAWYYLPKETREKIAENAAKITKTDGGEIVIEQGNTRGLGGFDWHLKEAGGNPLKALVKEWLESGAIFDDEQQFSKVLDLAGMPETSFQSPYAEYPSVYPTFLSIKRPLVTTEIPPEVISALERRASRQRGPKYQHGADFWDKNIRDPVEWVKDLKADYAKGENSFVWSSIPDWVSDELKRLGYDGIKDVGGKMGGKASNIWVPFEPTQIKSATGNSGAFSPFKRDIRGFVALPEDEPNAASSAAKAAIPSVTKMPESLPPEAHGRAQRVLDVLVDAKPVRREQEAMYSASRSQRMARAMNVRENVGGESGYYAELGQLKGEMPRSQFESIRQKVSQVDIDEMMNDINRTLGFWDSLPAKSGLVKMLDGTVPTHTEIAALQKVFGSDLANELLAKQPLIQKLKDLGIQLLNLPRSMSAGLGDMSASLRQAVFVAPSHPIKWGRAFLDQFPQFASEEAFQASQRQIALRPSYELMRQHHLALTDVGGALTEQEERFMAANLIDKIPGIRRLARATNRAYVGMLNRLRADLFDDYVKSAQTLRLNEKAQSLMLDHASNFINNATGRGSLRVPIFGGVQGSKGLERSAVLLNSTFFSPRLVASRMNLLDPTYYARLEPTVRKEALKSLAAFVGAGTTTLALLKANGVQVGDDPRSADFGKVKVGNTRYDIWGGFQQPVRAMAQLITGKMISSTTGRESIVGEGYKPTTRLDILARYFQSKESPVASFITGWLSGKSATGEPFRVSSEVLDRFIPMVAQDMWDLAQEDGAASWWKALPSVFGVGVQTYGKQIPMKEKTPSGAEKIGFRSPESLGEAIINKATGNKVSDIPKELHPKLETARMNELKRKAEIDKAKRLTLEDGKTRRVGNTTIFLRDGIVKTRTVGKVNTVERAYRQSTKSK